MMVSGSLQALDLVNAALLAPGDTIICERDCYEGTLNRYTRRGINVVGIPLDQGGMRMDALEAALADLKAQGRAAEIHLHHPDGAEPDRHHPRRGPPQKAAGAGGSLRRADLRRRLLFRPGLERQASGRALCDEQVAKRHPHRLVLEDDRAGVARRFRRRALGVLSRLLPLKTDAGSGGLEQMMLAEYCEAHFAEHVPRLRKRFQAKLDTMVAALNEQFGTAAEFDYPPGGIFLWVKLPDEVDAMKLREAALAAGVAINPGPEWSIDKAYSRSRIRLCFASPTHDEIREGIALLAEVCRKEFGVPERSANVARREA